MSASPRVKRRVGVVLTATLLAIGAPFVAHIGSAEAAEVAAAGFVTSAKVDRPQATIGQSVAVTVSVKSDTTRRALIDLEIYDRTGRKVFQKAWDNESFTAGQTRQLTLRGSTGGLAAGAYTAKVGVFGVGWNVVHPLERPGRHRHAHHDRTDHHDDDPAHHHDDDRRPHHHDRTHHHDHAADHHHHDHDNDRRPRRPHPPRRRRLRRPAGSRRCRLVPPCPTGAQCAARVRSAAEIRPENNAANSNRGSRANANTRNDWAGFNRVDGDFAGTTDQIIQWAACKWGIDEDIVRAQIIKESYWYQSANGDNGESWGLGQVRDTAHQSAFQYSVNARTSSAYNLDYTYASWRACYEGAYTWLNNRRAQRHLRRRRRVGMHRGVVQRSLVHQHRRLPQPERRQRALALQQQDLADVDIHQRLIELAQPRTGALALQPSM